MKLPFGKNKGRDIKDMNQIADYNYLQWVNENVKMRPELKKEVETKIKSWFSNKEDKK